MEFAGTRKSPRHLCQGRNQILRGTTLIPRTVTQCALPAYNKATTCNGVSRPALLLVVTLQSGQVARSLSRPLGLAYGPLCVPALALAPVQAPSLTAFPRFHGSGRRLRGQYPRGASRRFAPTTGSLSEGDPRLVPVNAFCWASLFPSAPRLSRAAFSAVDTGPVGSYNLQSESFFY